MSKGAGGIAKAIAIMLIFPVLGLLVWLFMKKPKQTNGLYQMGYLGMPAPEGREQDASYLAGRMKRQREDSKNSLLSTQGTALGGLKIEGVTATFGKQRGGYDRY